MTSKEKDSSFNWDYDHPGEWWKHYPCAQGLCQSPIDIITVESIPEFYPPFKFSSAYQRDQQFTVKNTGRQILVTCADQATANELSFTGSALVGTFHFVNFHLHWGPTNHQGAEHEIDGHRYPAEAHFVHQNDENGQIAVLAMFFKIDDDDDDGVNETPESPWGHFIALASQLTEQNQTTTCALNLSRLMSVDQEEFYRYVGSLTTPPCTEGILWTIFLKEIPIRTASLNLLREKIMPQTFRPIQPLNGRTIFRNYQYSNTI